MTLEKQGEAFAIGSGLFGHTAPVRVVEVVFVEDEYEDDYTAEHVPATEVRTWL